MILASLHTYRDILDDFIKSNIKKAQYTCCLIISTPFLIKLMEL